MLRHLSNFCVSTMTIMLMLQPVSAADVRFRPSETLFGSGIMGQAWSLVAGGATDTGASAGHAFLSSYPLGVYGTRAQSEFWISGELNDAFHVGPTFSVNIPLESEFPEFNVFWLEGSSSGHASYDSSVWTNSGFPPPPVAPASWIIDVLPTGNEVPGTPARIDIHATFAGLLTANGNGSSAASWFVSTDHGTILDGTTTLEVSGTQPISDIGDDSFLVLLGDSFELQYRYELLVSGAGEAISRSEISESFIGVSATVVPEPSTLALVVVGVLSLRRGRR